MQGACQVPPTRHGRAATRRGQAPPATRPARDKGGPAHARCALSDRYAMIARVAFVFRVTKYDPEHFGAGGYQGPQDCDSDRGPLERAYLDVVAGAAAEVGVDGFCI